MVLNFSDCIKHLEKAIDSSSRYQTLSGETLIRDYKTHEMEILNRIIISLIFLIIDYVLKC